MVPYTCKVKETKQRLQPNATMSQYTRMVEFSQHRKELNATMNPYTCMVKINHQCLGLNVQYNRHSVSNSFLADNDHYQHITEKEKKKKRKVRDERRKTGIRYSHTQARNNCFVTIFSASQRGFRYQYHIIDECIF